MTISSPPRFAQAMLESLGAAPEFRDAILGDLAQEFAARSDRYGKHAAQLWYYREALRTAPHLVRNWIGSAGLKEARRLLNVVGLSYVLTLMIQTVMAFGVSATWTAAREGLGLPAASTSVIVGGALLLTLTRPVIAGYIAASLSDESPMIAAIATGFTWVMVSVITTLVSHLTVSLGATAVRVPLWTMGFGILTILVGSLAGGSLQVLRRARAA